MELNQKIPNLLRATTAPPPPKPASKDNSRNWKLLAFDILAVLSAGAVGYTSLLYFSGGVSFTMFTIIAGVFFLASFFDFLFTPVGRRSQLLALLQILAFLGFFYAVKPTAILSAFAVLAAFYFLANKGAHAVMENSLKFRLGHVARIYMKRLFIGFTVAAILLYLPQWNSGNVFVPQPKFQRWYDGFAEFSNRFYSGVDLKSTVGGFAESAARSQLATNSQFNALPPSMQDEVVRRAAQELIANTSKGIGLQLAPDMPLAEAFYKYLVNFLTNLKTQFGDSFLAAWAVALFVIVLSVGTLMIWGVIIVAYILFEAMSAFNLAYISGENRTKEVVELS